MKKNLLLLFALLLGAAASAWADVEINETNFPDEAFRNWVMQWDTDNSGGLSEQEISAAGDTQIPTAIYINNMGISNLKGIEYFTHATILHCTGNNLTELDVSALENLWFLQCSDNQLESLKIHPNLSRLHAYNNNLSEFVIPENSRAWELKLYNNQLQSFQLPLNMRFERNEAFDPATIYRSIQLNYNPITSLNFSSNAEVHWLDVSDTQLNTIDVSQLPSLVSLSMNNCPISHIDLSQNTSLGEFYAQCTSFESLDFSNNTQLKSLNVGWCENLTEINFVNSTELETFDCPYTSLKSLDLSQNTYPYLYFIYADNCQLETMDLSGCTGLNELRCRNNKLTELRVNSPWLSLVRCENNQLTSLDVSASTEQLTTLHCYNNKLEEFHFNYPIVFLTIFNNQLKKEAMDEIVLARQRFAPYTWNPQCTWVVNLDDPNEGNEMDYTQASALNAMNSPAFAFEGDVDELASFDNMENYMYSSMEFDGNVPSVVIDDNGFATFSSVVDYDLSNTYGSTAYSVLDAQGNSYEMTEVSSDALEAGTGIILKGEPGTELYIPAAVAVGESWGSPISDNLLAGNLKARTFAAGEAYILKDGKFVLTQGDREELPCHTAYIPAENVVNGGDVLYLNGEVTGVEEITASTNDENAPIYDVMGRRVLNPQPGGIYIQNGKKFIQR